MPYKLSGFVTNYIQPWWKSNSGQFLPLKTIITKCHIFSWSNPLKFYNEPTICVWLLQFLQNKSQLFWNGKCPRELHLKNHQEIWPKILDISYMHNYQATQISLANQKQHNTTTVSPTQKLKSPEWLMTTKNVLAIWAKNTHTIYTYLTSQHTKCKSAQHASLDWIAIKIPVIPQSPWQCTHKIQFSTAAREINFQPTTVNFQNP